ncbi:ankyrin [Choiromyces venosus 120613-1]|uniref:Ankyrin n=1 Tax=Choiromyces venosus 120613-1 TaxID=1336337 RepID=A0A3N4K030_9PEZI|nr:ankyrin [Choiromyces venosus 120613-1]
MAEPLQFSPYVNSIGFFLPRVMITNPGSQYNPAPPPSAFQAGMAELEKKAKKAAAEWASQPPSHSPQAAPSRSESPREPTSRKQLSDKAPGRSSSGGSCSGSGSGNGDDLVVHHPLRKRSRIEDLSSANKEAGAAILLKRKMSIQDVPSWVLKEVLKWQVQGEDTRVTVREIANLVLVSKEFRILFHPELIHEGIRHAARTRNHKLLRRLITMTPTVNFPAWDRRIGRKTHDITLPPVGAPLHECAGANDPIGVVMLLSAGADPNFCDCRHETALHRAAKTGGPLILVLLLKVGGDCAIRDIHMWTPFDVAIAHNNIPMIYAIWRLCRHLDGAWQPCSKVMMDPTGTSPIHKALNTDCRATLELLLALPHKVDVRDVTGATPLIYALRKEKCGRILHLLMKGKPTPDALLKDRSGKTSLFYTEYRSCKDPVAKMLFEKYYSGLRFNAGLLAARIEYNRRFEHDPSEHSFVFHY